MRLPIDQHLPDVVAALRARGAVVLVAPTGSGKTTRVPPALVDAGFADAGRVVVLQPRRVAARLAARRIAAERGCAIGDEVGYRVRFEDRTSRRTRIEVVTEGVLTRLLLSDPFLEGVSVVILDELHERSLDADVALAATRAIRAVRPDLCVVAMSATLDAGPIAAFLDAAVIEASGRAHPVTTHYDRQADPRPPTLRAAPAIRDALRTTRDGHVLCFLAGAGDIARVASDLADLDVPVLPLHGRLDPSAQDAALAPSEERKVVLATNIAETSVTLEGVVAVVDTGEAKVATFDPAYGLVRLERQPIARSSADQRAGRAGRTGPGLCRRLWTESDHAARPPFETPEIRRSDLAEVVVLLRAWGSDPRALAWLESPPAGALSRAERLLDDLGSHAELARIPVHPRLGRVLLAAHAGGFLSAAAVVAALTEERDPFDADALPLAEDDLLARLAALRDARGPRVQRVRQVAEHLRSCAIRALGRPDRDEEPTSAALVEALLTGLSDRVARHRGKGRYVLAGGGSATLEPASRAHGAPLILAVGLTVGAREQGAHIRAASPVPESALPIRESLEVRFDPEREAVVHVRVRRAGAWVVDEQPAHEPADPMVVARVLADAAIAAPQRAIALTPAAERLCARLRFVRRVRPDLALPDPSPEGMLPDLCAGRRSFGQLRAVDWVGALHERLTWAQRQALDALAPERIEVPSGANLRLEYPDDGPPVLAARMQQLFGWKETPTVAGAPLLLHLLAPNQRPVQITQDLAGFWERTWPEVRKDLRGRYPKHAWPDDPANASATRRRR